MVVLSLSLSFFFLFYFVFDCWKCGTTNVGVKSNDSHALNSNVRTYCSSLIGQIASLLLRFGHLKGVRVLVRIIGRPPNQLIARWAQCATQEQMANLVFGGVDLAKKKVKEK